MLSHFSPLLLVHAILQAGIVKWVPRHYSMGSSPTWDGPTSLMSPSLASEFFATSVT